MQVKQRESGGRGLQVPDGGPRPRHGGWTALMKQGMGLDLLSYPRGSAPMTIMASIEERDGMAFTNCYTQASHTNYAAVPDPVRHRSLGVQDHP